MRFFIILSILVLPLGIVSAYKAKPKPGPLRSTGSRPGNMDRGGPVDVTISDKIQMAGLGAPLRIAWCKFRPGEVRHYEDKFEIANASIRYLRKLGLFNLGPLVPLFAKWFGNRYLDTLECVFFPMTTNECHQWVLDVFTARNMAQRATEAEKGRICDILMPYFRDMFDEGPSGLGGPKKPLLRSKL